MPRDNEFCQSVWKLVLFTALAGLLVCGTQSFAADPAEGQTQIKRTLVIGATSDNPKKHYRRLKPMVDYVVKHLKHLGISEGQVLLAKDNRQLARYMRDGRVDWVTETPFAAVLLEEGAGAEFFLRKWKKGVEDYHTIVFTRKDSGINSLEQLKGKTLAFEDRFSSSAYFIPVSVLISQGLSLTELSSPREKPQGDRVGYIFSGEEINQSTWVYKGLVDAAAFSNTDWDEADTMPPAFKEDLQIIYRSRPFPRAVELVRSDLAPELKAELKKILLEAHQSSEGRAALKAYNKSEKIDLLDDDSLAGLEEARRILHVIQKRLE